MKKLCLILAVMAVAMSAKASWYWPFGGEEKPKPPRISELMEPASLLIEDAAELAVSNRVDEAVKKYQQAIAELDRIEIENPERAATPEFATIRLKRSYCNAAIDSLFLAQAKNNARSVSVTDTTELEKKRAKMLAEKKGEKTKKIAENAVVQQEKSESIREEPIEEKDDELTALRDELKKNPKARRARLRVAAADLAKKDYAAAMLSVQELLQEKPNDASALNLKAAIETQQGDYKTAEKTLEQCIKSNPRNYYAYYNLAELILTTRQNGKEVAKRYYEAGRAYGGAVDAELEERLK